MLLFPSERLYVVLAPDGFGLVRPKSKQVVEGAVSLLATGQPDMHRIQTSLIAAITASQCRKPRLHFVLSGALLRFAELPWSPVFLQEDEQQTVLGARLSERYGDMGGWSMALAKTNHGRSRVGCALQATWLALIKQVASECSAKVISVKPYFLNSWNQWCLTPESPDLSEQTGPMIYGVIENGCLVCARITADGIQEMHTQRIEAPGQAELVDSVSLNIDRLRWGLGEGSTRSICLHAPGWDVDLRNAITQNTQASIAWVQPSKVRQSALRDMLQQVQTW